MRPVCCPTREVSLLLLVVALTACGPPGSEPSPAPETPAPPVAAEPTPARPAVDALDKRTADARRARLANVAYDLDIDLTGEAEAFGGEATVAFDLVQAPTPGDDLTLDFGGGEVLGVEIDGAAVRAGYNGHFLTLPAAALAAGRNTVRVRFSHPYSEDGTGLHRFVDPVDGRTYLYSYLWPYYANRLFPAFDQPNLKARLTLSVRAPEDWLVVSMAPGNRETAGDGSALWRFETTPPMATYAFSLHAGPYHVWESRFDDGAESVPLRLMARRSLAEFVAVDEWFEITRRGLAHFGAYFEIPYPWGKYDQLIVPDFAIGAMENIAAVTFSEQYVQRQPSSRGERERRQGVILHEMAHMWFGDLVTHEWWNGLWLNESFATQMAAVAMQASSEFTDTWHGFFVGAKQDAYRADSRVTTHPIEVPVNSTADFFSVFDDITYEKGSSVLKQLAHAVGEENYRRGVSAYLKAHAYGNTELEDFIGAVAEAAGRALDGWSRDWLYQPGFDTLAARPECADGLLTRLVIEQTAPEAHPVLRRHRVDVALYHADADGVVADPTVLPVDIEGATTEVALPGGLPCPALVNPNHDDWTLAAIALDERTLAGLDTLLPGVPEPLARSMFLDALYDRAMAGAMPLARYLEHATALAAAEPNIRVQQQISATLGATVAMMQRLRPETDGALAQWLPRLEADALSVAGGDAAPDLKRTALETFLAVAATDEARETMRALLDGERSLPGLPMSQDLRWRMLVRLAELGEPSVEARLAAEREADPSDYGVKAGLTADAALPEAARKARWLAELRRPEALDGLARQRAVMAGLFPPNQAGLQATLRDEVLGSLPGLSHRVDPYFMSSYVRALLAPVCTAESAGAIAALLESQGAALDSTALRFTREALQADRECVAIRGAQ